jgi:hypothetical protein
MLKVKRVRAVSVALTDSINAVLLQQGDTWEGLCCYVCVTPGAFVGQKVITMDDETHGSRFTALFERAMGKLGEEVIVMASPGIASAMYAIEKAEADQNPPSKTPGVPSEA